MHTLKDYLPLIQNLAQQAGQAILDIYQQDHRQIWQKEDDSPLTLADQAAHRIIQEGLLETGLPILSEEGQLAPYQERSQWRRFWLVDPLDGTKEFIKGNGEFTVNIALIEAGAPVLGVIGVPVQDRLYWGGKGLGAFQQQGTSDIQDLQTQPQPEGAVTLVASRSHLNDETAAFMARFPDAAQISMGSSLKFMLIAEGQAQYYPRFAPTKEWDTAAAQAILEAAGGHITLPDGVTPLVYNKSDLQNPHFLAQA